MNLIAVGKAIDVECIKNPTDEEVDALHKKYMEGILNLFNSEKHKYLEDPDTELIME